MAPRWDSGQFNSEIHFHHNNAKWIYFRKPQSETNAANWFDLSESFITWKLRQHQWFSFLLQHTQPFKSLSFLFTKGHTGSSTSKKQHSGTHILTAALKKLFQIIQRTSQNFTLRANPRWLFHIKNTGTLSGCRFELKPSHHHICAQLPNNTTGTDTTTSLREVCVTLSRISPFT